MSLRFEIAQGAIACAFSGFVGVALLSPPPPPEPAPPPIVRAEPPVERKAPKIVRANWVRIDESPPLTGAHLGGVLEADGRRYALVVLADGRTVTVSEGDAVSDDGRLHVKSVGSDSVTLEVKERDGLVTRRVVTR